MSKKKRRPSRGPNLSYYETYIPGRSSLKHRHPSCRGTILVPVSSRDPGKIIGRAVCSKCGVLVGRKAMRSIWKAVECGSYVPELRPLKAGFAMAFRHPRASLVEPQMVEESYEQASEPLDVAECDPQRHPRRENLWRRTGQDMFKKLWVEEPRLEQIEQAFASLGKAKRKAIAKARKGWAEEGIY